MKTQLIISLKIILLLTLLTGIIYPLFMTGLAQLIFPGKANGSLIEKDGKTIGSRLVGQAFRSDAYFSSRPSANDYATLPSAGSNLALTNKKLVQQVTERKDAFMKRNNINSADSIPSEMLFASASGLDPHVSPQAALLQVERIAGVRKFTEAQKQKLNTLILDHIENPQFGFMGEERVNVLLLNLQLDEIK